MKPQSGRFFAFARSKSTRQSNDGDRTIAIINTEGVDRHGTIIDPSGLDVTDYRENPIFLLNHDHDQVGGTSEIKLKDGRWQSEVSDGDWSKRQLAQDWKQDVKDGIIRMTSVGIIPHEVNEREIARDSKEKQNVPVIETSELLEWSFVAVGSNPEALIQQRNAQDDFMQKLEALHKKIDQILDRELKLADSQIDALIAAFQPAQPPAPEPEPKVKRKPRTTVISDDKAAELAVMSLEKRLGKI